MRLPAGRFTLRGLSELEGVNMWSLNVNWDDGIVVALSGRCVELGRCSDFRHGWVGLLATERP
jgi:hypothetical protein